MYYRKTEKAVEFKTKLGFNPINLIMLKEELVETVIMKSFPGEKMTQQYSVNFFFINNCFHFFMINFKVY